TVSDRVRLARDMARADDVVATTSAPVATRASQSGSGLIAHDQGDAGGRRPTAAPTDQNHCDEILVDFFAVPDRVGATAALATRLVGIAAAGEAPRGLNGLTWREVGYPERRGVARLHARLAVARAQDDVSR